MKRIMPIVVIYLLFLLFPSTADAQFEGKIVYGIEYRNYPNADIDLLSKLPQQTVLYINGESILFEQSVHGGGSQRYISNSYTNERYLWMNLIGESFLVILPKDLPLSPTETIKYISTKRSRKIAGYTCSEVQVISKSDTVMVWYTGELKTSIRFQKFQGLKGFPLQYEVKSEDGSTMVLTAISVEPIPIPIQTFERPPGLAQITLEEFQNTFKN